MRSCKRRRRRRRRRRKRREGAKVIDTDV